MEEIGHIEQYRIPETAQELTDEQVVGFLGKAALEADIERYHTEAAVIEQQTDDMNSWQRHRWYLGIRQESQNGKESRRKHPTRKVENLTGPIYGFESD